MDTARKLFQEQGFEATSVDAIAHSSEVSKGAIYHHFADKKKLFAELFCDVQAAVMEAVVNETAELTSDWERAAVSVHTFLHSYLADERALAILRQAPSVLGQQGIRDVDERVALPFVRGLLEQLQSTGHLQPVPVPATAKMIFGMLCEATALLADSDEPAQAAQEAETIVLYMLSGLLLPADPPA